MIKKTNNLKMSFSSSIIVPVTITQHTTAMITSTTTTTTSTPTPLLEDSSEETSSTALMLPTSGSPGCVIDDRFYSDGMQVNFLHRNFDRKIVRAF